MTKGLSVGECFIGEKHNTRRDRSLDGSLRDYHNVECRKSERERMRKRKTAYDPENLPRFANQIEQHENEKNMIIAEY